MARATGGDRPAAGRRSVQGAVQGAGWRDRLGIGLCTVGLVTAMAGVLQAIGPLRYGQYVQSESVVAALYLAGALAAAGLAAAAWSRPGRVGGILRQPVVMAPLALAGWTGLVSPAHPVPAMTWFGFPVHGEGVLWWLSVGLLVAAALHLRGVRRLCRGLVLLQLLLVVGCGALTGLYGTGSAAPYWFPDYLAFPACFVLPAVLGWGRCRGGAVALAAVGLTGVLLAMSWNLTAWAAVAAVAPAAGVIWLLCRHQTRGRTGGRTGDRTGEPTWLPSPRAAALAGVAAIPIAMTAAVVVTGDRFGFATNWDRTRLLEMTATAVAADPQRLAVGFGWGQVSDMLVRHALLDSVRFTADGDWAPNWAAVTWRYWHSHNQFADALIAGGIVGLGLFGWVVLAPLQRARRRLLPVAAFGCGLFAATAVTWFQMPGMLAPLVLGYAGLAGPVRRSRRSPTAVRASMIVLSLLLAGALAVQLTVALRAGALLARPLPLLAAAADRCADLLPDGGRGGVHLSDQYTGRLQAVSDRVRAPSRPGDPPAVATMDDLAGLAVIACAADRWRREPQSLRLALSDVLGQSELAYLPVDPAATAARDALLADWEARLDAFLDRAPARTDLTAPYYAWRVDRGEEPTALAFAERRLAIDSGDPVALWFSGLILLGRSDTDAASGLTRMNRAIDLGVADLILVPPGTIDQVRAARRNYHEHIR